MTLQGDQPYQQLQEAAEAQGSTLTGVVNEALEQWLDALDAAADMRAAADAVSSEPGANIPWELVKQEMRLLAKG